MCDTRWTERHDSVLQFDSKFEKIVEVLNIISNWKDREASSKAESLKTAITSTEFIVSLKCLCDLCDILALTVNLSKILQSKTTDKQYAVKLIGNISVVRERFDCRWFSTIKESRNEEAPGQKHPWNMHCKQCVTGSR
ncbi:unnamed protein product [Acanthoscelides obtectus]|uniref:Uncharacterized protein n=1 Tax=Acanthoscelides obtectus TaxID=200917 RepID=A0A9P0KHP2_ACAOB|nr:unnamed protein product [Acanthoscelides obtectus]CAK1632432.1 hypothetical protein AOBTE_LOCUS7561 [Acanthoscelides obtectus]